MIAEERGQARESERKMGGRMRQGTDKRVDYIGSVIKHLGSRTAGAQQGTRSSEFVDLRQTRFSIDFDRSSLPSHRR
jgi:hypothetical protein